MLQAFSWLAAWRMERSGRPKLEDVAEATGVSAATVSRALSRPDLVQPETLARVRRAAARLGYMPAGAARALASGRTMTVGAVVPTLDHAIFARAIQSLQTVLLGHSYQLLIASHEYSALTEAAAVRSMLTRGVDALMLVGADHLDETWNLLAAASVPVLITWSRDDRFPCIWFDNARAGRLAAEHLVGLGHRRVGMISGRLRWNDRARLRVEGVRAALAEVGLDLPDWCVIEEPFTLAGGRAGMAQLLAAARPPTAFVCGNDLLAVGALLEAQARGLRVPDDLSIVGIDNLEIAAHLSPALTTVHLPTAQLGERVGQTLVTALRGGAPPASIELPIELVMRRSSGLAPGRADQRSGMTGRRARA
jgi:LacI family transcriptional regulator